MNELTDRHAYAAGRVALLALEHLPTAVQLYLRLDGPGNYRIADAILKDGRRASLGTIDEAASLYELQRRARPFVADIIDTDPAPYINVDRAAVAYQENYTS